LAQPVDERSRKCDKPVRQAELGKKAKPSKLSKGRTRPAGGGAFNRTWLWGAGLAAAGLGVAAWFGLNSLVPIPLPKDFPGRPDLSAGPVALVRLVDDAEQRVRTHPRSAEAIGRLAMVYHANQFYDQAQSAYRIASRLKPGDYRWVYYQALVEEEQGQEQDQHDLLLKTVELQPGCVPALQKLGDIAFKQNRLAEAVRYYEQSDRAAGPGKSAQAVFGLGRAAARQADWPRVVAHLAPLAQEHPHLRPTYQLLAEAYEALGDSRRAAGERGKLLNDNLIPVPPVSDPLHHDLLTLCCSSTRLLKEAGLLSRFGQPGEAIRLARRAIEIEPEDADVRHLLAKTLLDARGGEPEAVNEALGHLAEGLRLRPDDSVPLYYFAAFFFRNHKTQAAIERLRALLREKTGKAEAHYYLGVLAERLGETDQAQGQYQEALRLDPGYAEPCDGLGLLLAAAGRLNEAVALFEKAVQLKPTFTRARSNLGVAYEQQGKIAQATAQYREALRLKPNDGETHLFLAIALLKTGQVEESIEQFREAVMILPADPQAHYGLGCALAAQGRSTEAAEELRQALRLRPDHAGARAQLRKLENR
jgi:tetratricopeptide (TPR) repeat protein